MTKLKTSQEIMHTRNNAGRIEISMVKFVPTAYGIEQYIDTGNGFQLRAQIAEKDWPEWLKADANARRAQELDDGVPRGTIRQTANAAKLTAKRRQK
jgi:hypothetical protein